MRAPLGSLPLGTRFKTLLSGRVGVVLDHEPAESRVGWAENIQVADVRADLEVEVLTE